jgi:hypothetical protein
VLARIGDEVAPEVLRIIARERGCKIAPWIRASGDVGRIIRLEACRRRACCNLAAHRRNPRARPRLIWLTTKGNPSWTSRESETHPESENDERDKDKPEARKKAAGELLSPAMPPVGAGAMLEADPRLDEKSETEKTVERGD